MLLPCIDSTPPPSSNFNKLSSHVLNTCGKPCTITCPFSKYIQILYIFAQIFKCFALFCPFLPFLGKITWMPLPSRIGPDQIQGVIVPLLTYNSRKNVSFVNKVRKKSFEMAENSLCTNWCGGL